MKNDPIKLNRNEWELLKEFQKAPFKKRFSEILEQERNLQAEIKKELQETIINF